MSTAQPPVDPSSDKLVEQLLELLENLQGLVKTLGAQTEGDVTHVAARDLRALADAIESRGAGTGKDIDQLIARLERDIGPLLRHDPKAAAQQRQEEAERSARSSIADALREAGITPLNAPDPSGPGTA
jgi:hypothetical protein